MLAATESEANALVRWPGGTVHRRRIGWEDDAILVRDTVEGAGPHSAESRLPIAAGAVARIDGEAEVERGLRSERLFQREEGDVLVRRERGQLPLAFEWRIRR